MRARDDRRNSMIYWWPRVKNLGIPVPRTEIVRLRPVTIDALSIHRYTRQPGDEPIAALCRWERAHRRVCRVLSRLGNAAYSIARSGQPLFIRTDLSAAKHSYRETCYCDAVQYYPVHIYALAEAMDTADIMGLPWRAIVFREYIPLAARFTAFWGHLPIAPERRYFVRDGRVECRHPYWPAEALATRSNEARLPADWRDQLAEMNTETPEEVELLTGYAERVAAVLPGYWSVDFALAADGRWILIDMATGDDSWHPECPMRRDGQ
ncbi:MAG: hypothetical protein C4551_06570 [Bacillota bacterium]|jgi:hypothetical protein|nr:MAG: hypothetical protein C4551_06570 [Bacillota bacterium]